MACLVIGRGSIPEHLLLETDLGHPLLGLPGMVSLFHSKSLILQYYIGYSSAKQNTQKYLQAVHNAYHKYLSDYSQIPLTVHCHNWKSGIGKVIISDIIKLTQPVEIVEFYDKSPQIEAVLAESCSFLEGSYHKPRASFRSVKVTEEKSSDVKADRSKLILNYLGTNNPQRLCSLKPKVCFIGDVLVRLNGECMEERLYSVMVGKVVGLCEKESGKCFGVGVIRDFNQENGMIYVVSPLEELGMVDCLDCFSGDGAIGLEKNDIYCEGLEKEFELDLPYVLPFVVLGEKINKYHPKRNVGK